MVSRCPDSSRPQTTVSPPHHPGRAARQGPGTWKHVQPTCMSRGFSPAPRTLAGSQAPDSPFQAVALCRFGLATRFGNRFSQLGYSSVSGAITRWFCGVCSLLEVRGRSVSGVRGMEGGILENVTEYMMLTRKRGGLCFVFFSFLRLGFP